MYWKLSLHVLLNLYTTSGVPHRRSMEWFPIRKWIPLVISRGGDHPSTWLYTAMHLRYFIFIRNPCCRLSIDYSLFQAQFWKEFLSQSLGSYRVPRNRGTNHNLKKKNKGTRNKLNRKRGNTDNQQGSGCTKDQHFSLEHLQFL